MEKSIAQKQSYTQNPLENMPPHTTKKLNGSITRHIFADNSFLNVCKKYIAWGEIYEGHADIYDYDFSKGEGAKMASLCAAMNWPAQELPKYLTIKHGGNIIAEYTAGFIDGEFYECLQKTGRKYGGFTAKWLDDKSPQHIKNCAAQYLFYKKGRQLPEMVQMLNDCTFGLGKL